MTNVPTYEELIQEIREEADELLADLEPLPDADDVARQLVDALFEFNRVIENHAPSKRLERALEEGIHAEVAYEYLAWVDRVAFLVGSAVRSCTMSPNQEAAAHHARAVVRSIAASGELETGLFSYWRYGPTTT